MNNMQQGNNNIIVIAGVSISVLAILTGGYYLINNNLTAQNSANSSSKAVQDAMTKKEAKMQSESAMKSTEMMKKEEVMEKKDTMMSSVSAMSKSSEVMVKTGTYQDYNSSLLSNASGGKVVIFFKANWCSTCNSLDKDILSKNSQIPADTTILKVDYDNSQELRKKYSVTVQHTLVQVDNLGNLIKKTSGTPTLEEINAFLN